MNLIRVKTEFLPSFTCVHTTIWMFHMTTYKMHREKNRLELPHAVLNKSWDQYPMKMLLHVYSPLTNISSKGYLIPKPFS